MATPMAAEQKLELDDSARYDPQDSEVLIKLLSEYTDKLKGLCTEMDRLYQQRELLGTIVSSAVLLVGAAGFFFMMSQTVPLGKGHLPWDFWLVWGVAAGLLFTLFVTVMSNSRQRIKAQRLDVHTTTAQLERLIRRTSQVGEYAAVPFAKRLEMDFRLADAEGMLKHASQSPYSRARDEGRETRSSYA